MFETPCVYQPTRYGVVFLPEDIESDYGSTLRVHFEPIAYYPAERDIGAGADFVANIGTIEMLDDCDRHGDRPHQPNWRTLEGAFRAAAIQFLERVHHKALWRQAEIDTAEAFGVSIHGVSA